MNGKHYDYMYLRKSASANKISDCLLEFLVIVYSSVHCQLTYASAGRMLIVC